MSRVSPTEEIFIWSLSAHHWQLDLAFLTPTIEHFHSLWLDLKNFNSPRYQFMHEKLSLVKIVTNDEFAMSAGFCYLAKC